MVLVPLLPPHTSFYHIINTVREDVHILNILNTWKYVRNETGRRGKGTSANGLERKEYLNKYSNLVYDKFESEPVPH